MFHENRNCSWKAIWILFILFHMLKVSLNAMRDLLTSKGFGVESLRNGTFPHVFISSPAIYKGYSNWIVIYLIYQYQNLFLYFYIMGIFAFIYFFHLCIHNFKQKLQNNSNAYQEVNIVGRILFLLVNWLKSNPH